MIVLDACAVLALLKGEPAAEEVRRLIEADATTALTPPGVGETVDHLVRRMGADEDEAILDIAQLGVAPPRPLDTATALRAGLLRARHYHRRDRPVSLNDCVVIETARAGAGAVASADRPLLATCAEEGVSVVALPDSHGERWAG